MRAYATFEISAIYIQIELYRARAERLFRRIIVSLIAFWRFPRQNNANIGRFIKIK